MNSKQAEPRTGWRALVLGTVLIPINSFWMMHGSIWGAGYPTTVSLFYNVVFILCVLVALNAVLNRWVPRVALSQPELLLVYGMLCISSALAGLDLIQILIPLISGAVRLATPENEWAQLFWGYIPEGLTVRSTEVLQVYDLGESSLYLAEHFFAWLRPVLIWSTFLCLLLLVMLSINVLIRRQWTEVEKLSYPIIQLPHELTTPRFFSNRLLWLGFALAGGMDLLNGLNFLYPMVPSIGGRLYDLAPFFTEKPWNAAGWTPVAIFPYAVGMAFFIPLDLSFSCWFFYLFWKAERILASAVGLRSLPGFPYIDQQSAGAYLGLFVIAMWASRRHLARVFREAIAGEKPPDEPISPRAAMLCLLGGMAGLVFFSVRAGMSLWVAVVFFLLYFALSTAITRMRAELGSPVHDLHFSGPDMLLTTALPTRRFTPRGLTMLSFYWFFNRAHRSHPMPHQLEAFKLAERSRMNTRRLFWGLVIAIVLGSICGFWAYLDAAYRYGGKTGYAWQTFSRLENWLTAPSNTNWPATTAVGAGLGSTVLLFVMRMRFFWWSFHPAGFAVSSSWSMNLFWSSIFISWLVKSVLLRHGGVSSHRKAMPFFLGLILGEFVVGGLWTLRGAIFHVPTYKFLF